MSGSYLPPVEPRKGDYIAPSGSGRRRAGRVPTEGVTSSLGSVLDLSGSGMRVLAWRAPKDVTEIRIRGSTGELTVKGRIVWTKPIGFFKKELGIQFVDLTPEAQRALTEIGMMHRLQRAV